MEYWGLLAGRGSWREYGTLTGLYGGGTPTSTDPDIDKSALEGKGGACCCCCCRDNDCIESEEGSIVLNGALKEGGGGNMDVA